VDGSFVSTRATVLSKVIGWMGSIQRLVRQPEVRDGVVGKVERAQVLGRGRSRTAVCRRAE